MVDRRVAEAGGLVHHWAQGPMDVRPIVPVDVIDDRIAFWVFNYYIENIIAVAGVSGKALAEKVDWVLNRAPQAWSRSGVLFHRVYRAEDAQINLRFTDEPPVGWPHLPWGPGWYYHDAVINKNVAQMTSQPFYINDPFLLPFILGMELVGHGCFRMHDMYLHGHGAYVGAMGDGAAALPTKGFPTEAEIEDAKAWLKGEAPEIHPHSGVTVPSSPHIHREE